jgi:hypothetical protein
MQAAKAQPIAQAAPASRSSTEKYVLRYSEVARRAGLGAALHLLRENLSQTWCIWRTAFRSFHGHIRTQSAKGQATVRLGPHGHRGARNARTHVRTLYTQKLLAIHPWADLQDLEMFLMGFDAGETWASDSRDRLYREQIPEAESSWITPETAHEIHITLDMLKRQWYKSQYESPRHQDPSPSD